jgi:hypothetical protein
VRGRGLGDVGSGDHLFVIVQLVIQLQHWQEICNLYKGNNPLKAETESSRQDIVNLNK